MSLNNAVKKRAYSINLFLTLSIGMNINNVLKLHVYDYNYQKQQIIARFLLENCTYSKRIRQCPR